MKQIWDSMWRIILYAFGFGLVAWTGYHTYQMLYYTDPQPSNTALAIFGLLIFEGGLLLWFQLFQRDAKSIMQHVIALLGTITGLFLVIVAFSIYWFTPLNELRNAESTAKWTIIVATVLNLIYFLVYELSEPSMWERIQEGIHVALVLFKADQKAAGKVEAQADALAEELGEQRKQRAFAEARSRNSAPVKQVSGGGGNNNGNSNRPPMPQMPSIPSAPAHSFASEAVGPKTPPESGSPKV